MISTLTKLLIVAVLSSLVIMSCDMTESAKMNSEHSVEFAERNSNMRCGANDGQEFCGSSRMREPIQNARASVL
jgi:hypothetical protein